jgi:hypothetical protein
MPSSGVVASDNVTAVVTPAKAVSGAFGVVDPRGVAKSLDSRLRGNDGRIDGDIGSVGKAEPSSPLSEGTSAAHATRP